MLELKHISFSAQTEGAEKEILKDVSFTVDERFVAITGPNGGGKSSLAKLIGGIYKPTSGQILYNGADITGLSCEEGEVDNSVFDRYLVPLYKQASYKPYIIAAMIFMSKVKDPVNTLMALDAADDKRKKF